MHTQWINYRGVGADEIAPYHSGARSRLDHEGRGQVREVSATSLLRRQSGQIQENAERTHDRGTGVIMGVCALPGGV